jgi:predicted nucleic acid-binding protein
MAGLTLTVVDTSVLLAWQRAIDPGHQISTAALQAARATGEIAIPVTAFSEALVHPYARSLRVGRQAEKAMQEIGTVVPTTIEIGRQAAKLRGTRRIKLPDALIVATGLELKAAAILTLDQKWAGIDSRIKVLC